MKHDLHIVVVDLLNPDEDGDALGVAYLGTDPTEANEAFDRCNTQCESVRLFSYPSPTRTRHPAQEAADIKQRHDRTAVEQQKQIAALIAQHKEAKAAHQSHAGVLERVEKELAAISPEALAIVRPPTPPAPPEPPAAPEKPNEPPAEEAEAGAEQEGAAEEILTEGEEAAGPAEGPSGPAGTPSAPAKKKGKKK